MENLSQGNQQSGSEQWRTHAIETLFATQAELVLEAKKALFSQSLDKEFVYFLRLGTSIKIGYTQNFRNRLSQLRSTIPGELEVIAVVIGSRAFEKYLHNIFSEVRLSGEWFHNTNPLKEYIERFKSLKVPTDARHSGLALYAKRKINENRKFRKQ